MAKYLNIRLSAELGERIAKHAARLRKSVNAFTEEAVESICDMAEDSTTRNLPELIVQLDALAKTPVPLAHSGEKKGFRRPTSYSTATERIGPGSQHSLNEEQPQMRRDRAAG